MTPVFDVVVVTTHDIGRHLHCYGIESVSSPNLDALGAEGVMFTRAFATAPQCSPSRASLATGLYPHNHGVMGLAHHGFDWELSKPHAAAVFADNGFQSHLFVGQHVTQNPERLGFTAIHPTIDDLDEVLTSTDERLYLEVNFEETHRPYPPAGPSRPGLVVPGYLPDGPQAVEEMTALEQTIAAMDTSVGRVMEALERAGRAQNALLVFTTDHGLAMPRAKCTLYDPGIEVALIMRWPGGRPEGMAPVEDQLVSNIDVLPALLEAADLRAGGLQGRSPLSSPARDAIFAEKTFHSYYDPMRCVRTATHKYIRNFESAFLVEVPADIQQGPIFRAHAELYSTDRPSTVELYDLRGDPLEQRNLAGTPAVKDVERELRQRLWAWMKDTRDPLLEGPVASPRYRLAMDS